MKSICTVYISVGVLSVNYIVYRFRSFIWENRRGLDIFWKIMSYISSLIILEIIICLFLKMGF